MIDSCTLAELSAVIVTRNTCALTQAALRSVLGSPDGLRKDAVVVDNGSVDDTPQALPREFPAVKYLRSERNLGFARANNLGAQACGGEFLLLLNSDARVDPGALPLAVEWMRLHPECAVAGAQLLNPDGSLQNSIANCPSLATELLNKSLLRRLFPHRFPGKEHPFTQPVEVESVIGAFMLIRRAVWEKLGGLDERYFFFFEETDFCLQARRHGWKVFHLPQVRVWHEQGRSAGQMPTGARIDYWRSRYAFFKKNRSLPAWVLLRAGLCARLLVNWLSSGLFTLATLGGARWRQRWHTHSTLLRWHLAGCPDSMGLPR
jgi:GT2 family glycosyltransferase